MSISCCVSFSVHVQRLTPTVAKHVIPTRTIWVVGLLKTQDMLRIHVKASTEEIDIRVKLWELHFGGVVAGSDVLQGWRGLTKEEPNPSSFKEDRYYLTPVFDLPVRRTDTFWPWNCSKVRLAYLFCFRSAPLPDFCDLQMSPSDQLGQAILTCQQAPLPRIQ